MSAVAGLASSVTTPGAALLMASTLSAIIGDPAAAAASGQPPTLGLQVQTKAVDTSQV
jgi:hypothetical protein